MKFTHTDADLAELGNRVRTLIHDMFYGKVDDFCRDSLAIISASKLLQISEFRFFQISYSQWFGHEVGEHSMEVIFSLYLKEDIVPHWVRHFSRRVLALEKQGTLNPEHFNIVPQKPSADARKSGVLYIILLLFLTVLFCMLIVGY